MVTNAGQATAPAALLFGDRFFVGVGTGEAFDWPIDSAHHIAEDSPHDLADALIEFLA